MDKTRQFMDSNCIDGQEMHLWTRNVFMDKKGRFMDKKCTLWTKSSFLWKIKNTSLVYVYHIPYIYLDYVMYITGIFVMKFEGDFA